MELEVVVGTYDASIIGCSLDLLQQSEEQVLKKKYHERGHVGCVRCVASGGHYLASGGTDETIKLYDMRKHLDIGTLLEHEGSITYLCFHKNKLLLSASEDGTICVWKCGGNWDLLYTLSGHKYSVTCMSVHPSGKLALSVGKDRTVRTWNLSTGRAAFTLRLPRAADLVAWSPIGDHYVLAVGGTVTAHSVESGEVTGTFEVGKTVNINSMQFIQDTVLAIGGDQPVITLYSITSGERVASLEGHTSRVKGLALSPDNQLLFSASSNGTIKVWSLPEPLDASKCLCSVETGSRITCITALLPAEMSGGGGAEGKVKGKKKGRKRTLDTTEEKGVPGVMDTADSSKRTVVEQGTEDGRGKSLKSVVKKKKRKAHIV